MKSSRYMPVFTDINSITSEEEFKIYLSSNFVHLGAEKQYELMKNKNFVKLLFNSSPSIFRDFSINYFNDKNILNNLFSKENSPIIKDVDIAKTGKCLSYLMNVNKIYEIFLQEHNYYLLENINLNEYSFVRPLLDAIYENSPNQANDFIQNHPDYIARFSQYKKIKVSNPITIDEFNTLYSIKQYLKADDKSIFYSNFSIDTINSLVDSGYYSLLSEKDKKKIIDNYIIYYDYQNPPLSNNLFKNKDFFKQICSSTKLNSADICKVMKYIELHHSELYEKYNTLFKELIQKKPQKTIDDISYLYFNDLFTNIKYNVNMVLELAESLKLYRDKLDSKMLSILSNLNIDDIENVLDLEKMNQYFKKSNIDFSNVLYDYVSLARDTFSEELKDSLIPLNKNEKVVVEEGVKIHCYEGNPLSFVVHCSVSKTGDPKEFAKRRNAMLNSEDNNKYISASYINETNINVFSKEGIIYGFNNLKDMQLVSANPEDSFSGNASDNPVNIPSSYLNLDDFTNSFGYNELLFKPCKMKPDFIVCYDKIDDYDIEVAKKLNIDIVYINSNKYLNTSDKSYFKNTNKKYIN